MGLQSLTKKTVGIIAVLVWLLQFLSCNSNAELLEPVSPLYELEIDEDDNGYLRVWTTFYGEGKARVPLPNGVLDVVVFDEKGEIREDYTVGEEELIIPLETPGQHELLVVGSMPRVATAMRGETPGARVVMLNIDSSGGMLSVKLPPEMVAKNVLEPPPDQISVENERILLFWFFHVDEPVHCYIEYVPGGVQGFDTTMEQRTGFAWERCLVLLTLIPLLLLLFLLLSGRITLQSKTVASKEVFPVVKRDAGIYEKILKTLSPDERRVMKLILENPGETYQYEVGSRLGFSKAKTSRILDAMEAKELIMRIKRGRVNVVRPANWILRELGGER
ncbi:MAG: hypothetical protein DRO11_01565 [Methanobacteriota archaeon]|nr:MAG: hypothetical protein DRO11_01565 [Euryarchaeota archaeon]